MSGGVLGRGAAAGAAGLTGGLRRLARLGRVHRVAAAFLVVAVDARAGLGDLLEQEGQVALRARLRDRAIPRDEVALRRLVVRAAEEDLAALRALLREVAA